MGDSLSMIPLSALKPSKRNIRKTNRTSDIKSLAASIESHGLLQNLTVRQVAGDDQETFEVIAGGRRLAAMKLLARRKRIDKELPIPCLVLGDDDATDSELSLAENFFRVPVHPADQFDAFSKLQAEGLSADDIAARFGVGTLFVLQRLKLAAVSPRLMKAYRKDDMTLDQLTAFAISDDRNAQERVWADDPRKERPAHAIRRELTRSLVDADDRRARFVGKEAYETAGGVILRDLFDTEHGGYFADVGLLDDLASKKLAKAASTIQSEGWQWVESRPEMDYGYLAEFGRHQPEIEELSDDENQRLSKLSSQYDELVSKLREDAVEEAMEKLSALEAEINTLSEPREKWSDDIKKDCGAFVAIDYEGDLVVVRGLLSRNQTVAEKSIEKKPKRSGNGGIPDALRETLSAHRTMAVRVELGRKPEIAFAALVYTLVLRTFYDPAHEACVDIAPASTSFGQQDADLGESLAAKAFADDRALFFKLLPDVEDLWEWLNRRSHEDNMALLAHCTAGSVNGLWRRSDARESDRLRQADTLAAALELDMGAWWQPTRVSYFNQVTKDGILSAVTEGISKQAAENIATLKKGQMAQRAEELLKETGWLPEPLCTKASGIGEAAE